MKAKEILEKMTLQEKVSLCIGKDFWQTKSFLEYGLPSMFMCDGPTGLRKQEDVSDNLGINNSRVATCFPTALTMANTWNEKLEKDLGKHIGKQAKNQKVGMVLGPGINIKRNPLCGRNFEYFSEDPYLAGKMGSSFIKGLQSEDIACSLKHFACNNQEYNRFTSDGIIDERTLHEIYLKAFEIAVKEANPRCIMSSYPKVNGIHCSNNKKLLNDILREKWGFSGVVVTDWGGMDDRVEAMRAGNDLIMPGGSDYMEKAVIDAVNNHELDEEDINKCAERIINLVLKQNEVVNKDCEVDYDAHHKFALKAAQEGCVLLKNDNLLPLNKNDKLLLVGAMAKNIRYQGAGSSHVNAFKVDEPIDYFYNYEFTLGVDDYGNTNEKLLNEIEDKANNVDKIIVFAGLPERYESEGFDRDNLYLPQGHIDMINKAKQTGKKVIVVLVCGCVVDMNWQDNIDAILYTGLLGEAAGQAISNLLYGKANPAGRLSETWPIKYEDVPNSKFFNTQTDALYKESIYVGYRYYDSAKIPVRYPFGYGLSYSNFKYKNFSFKDNKIKLTIKNDSKYDGSEVIQIYVLQTDCPIFKANKELKAFKKVFIKAHEEKEVEFIVNDEFFLMYDGGWKISKGNYVISIGISSRDIIKEFKLKVKGETIEKKEYLTNSWYETLTGDIDDKVWEKLVGYKYEPKKHEKGKFTLEDSVMEMKDYSLIMKIMYKVVEKKIAKSNGGKVDYDNPEFKMMMACSAGGPMRSMMISGGIKGGLFYGLVDMANGHYLKGIIRMIKG